jgi:hypothetical protein
MQAAVAEPPALVRQFTQPRSQRGVVGTPAQVADHAPVRGDDAARPPLEGELDRPD